MKYTVIYVPKAEKQLAELWMNHPSRKANQQRQMKLIAVSEPIRWEMENHEKTT